MSPSALKQIWSLVGDPSGGQAPAANKMPSRTLRVVIINKQASKVRRGSRQGRLCALQAGEQPRRGRARRAAPRGVAELLPLTPSANPPSAPTPPHALQGCNVEIHLPSADPKSHAELHWLKADGGLTSNLVTWRGQTYYGTKWVALGGGVGGGGAGS
jgi:hypothetical protein